MAHSNSISLPASLELEGADKLSPLVLEESLRDLPGKRLVARGIWQGKQVVAKLFLDPRSAIRHWKREQKGILALQQGGIKSPLLLHSGRLRDQTPIHIFEWLPDATTALDIWEQAGDDTQRLTFLQQLMVILADHHRAGLQQKDLHLNNFLYSKGGWYTIDADSIENRRTGEALDLKSSLENLALFFAQLTPEFDDLIEPALEKYDNSRKTTADFYQQLMPVLTKKRTERRHKYVSKSYRTCSEFIRGKNSRQVAIYRRDADPERIKQLLADPDTLIAAGKMLKDGNSSTVVHIHHPDGDWVIKRYNVKNLWHGLKRCLRPSRAWISWGNAHRLAISGIATPKAVAVIEKSIGPLRWGAYYVCEYISGVDAAEYFEEGKQITDQNDPVALNFVKLFRILKQTGIFHGDCKATNFLIKNQQPWVIDLDAMKEFSSEQQYLRYYQIDRQRFLCNWHKNPKLLKWFDRHIL